MRPRMFVARCCCGVTPTPPIQNDPQQPGVTGYNNWRPGTASHQSAMYSATTVINPWLHFVFGYFYDGRTPVPHQLAIHHGYVLLTMNDLPQGSTIISATLSARCVVFSNHFSRGTTPIASQFTPSGDNYARARIYGSAEDNALLPPALSEAADLDARPRTEAFVDYEVQQNTYVGTPAGTVHQITFGNVKDIVQEIVNRPLWSGKLMFLFEDNGSGVSYGAGFDVDDRAYPLDGWNSPINLTVTYR